MLSQMYILAKNKDIKIPFRDENAHQIRSYIKYYQSLVKEHIRQSNYLEASSYNLEDKFIIKQVSKKIFSIEKVMVIINNNNHYLEACKNHSHLDTISLFIWTLWLKK